MIYNKNVENSSVKRAQMAGIEMLYIYGRVLLPKRLDCLRNFYNVSSIPNTKKQKNMIQFRAMQTLLYALLQKADKPFCKTDKVLWHGAIYQG